MRGIIEYLNHSRSRARLIQRGVVHRESFASQKFCSSSTYTPSGENHMRQRDTSQGPAPQDTEAVERERQSRDLHRLETGSGEDFPAGYRTASLDESTRPDPGAPAVSTAQRGVTGRKTSTGQARAVRQRRRTW